MPSVDGLIAIAASQFAAAPILSIEPLGRGRINDTFLVATGPSRFVLQRINAHVFPDPGAILANIRTLLDHAARAGNRAVPALRLPEIVPARSGADYWQDTDGGFWRALSYIEGARSHRTLANTAQAEETGHALGRFHALVAELDPALLHDTLPGFHIAPGYLSRFDAVRCGSPATADSPELRRACAFVEARRDFVGVLETAKAAGRLRLRVIHGDPKLDNVLFDEVDGRAVSLIDLDTVKPGLIHYDLGDALRSCCNRTGEENQAPESAFDVEVCRAILRGYMSEARSFLTDADRAHLYDAIRLLPLELGLRFLTDHLEGDCYFKVDAPGQNLSRALVQFRLAESVERQERVIRRIIGEVAYGDCSAG